LVKIDLFGNAIQEYIDEVQQPKKKSPFDFIKSIGSKKKQEDLEGYNKWIINAAFSMRKDTVIYANEMNRYPDLSEQEQHDFYFHGLPNRSYFAKWAKATKIEKLETIMEYYEVSEKVAKDYLKILTSEQVTKIEKEIERRKGGKL